MRSPILVVRTITRQDAAGRVLIEHNQMIETFAAYRAVVGQPTTRRCRDSAVLRKSGLMTNPDG